MASEAFNIKPEDMFTPRGEKYDLSIIPNLSGKVALVTGANSPGSIGYQIAQHLHQETDTVLPPPTSFLMRPGASFSFRASTFSE
ncbi:uncharacterized protein SCHCODRAFT_02697545 [Schizophyllum commune H4-8]|uniref:uncharacterized protein n=1 Tax=Schizophyllum commune (strain H4-8 / FGSC 9210) TaxID=578458 RepID=UPI002160926F|nr:uncharacterized protein SCHCODRAFT_02697545 [Schizophyllum commune H4-8]KAI5896066.1 hypothetical protein SCHCODRAFT_02697545 [Schizophyllum commune H4-8]